LLIQSAANTTRPCQYSLPGGRRKRVSINEIELTATAIVREVYEETGITINFPKLIQDWGDQAYFIASVQSTLVRLNKESMGYVWINPTVHELEAPRTLRF
jgi:ADP-ribose pyrophosphatase YjhB (NUDIX family)